VAEIMLQQTQVERVVPKWAQFLATLPTVAACARAEQAQVVRLWEGLGYHRRAVYLHRCASEIVGRHQSIVPTGLADLLALPGIGSYTARAVRVFAYEFDDAVLDTNVGRVVARAIAGRSLSTSEAQQISDALVPKGDGWAWNQGMLDLGALVCVKRQPRCEQCPVRSVCAWRGSAPSRPDPADGSAAVSGKQARFQGSDREGRGRILAALRSIDETQGQAVHQAALAAVTGWTNNEERLRRVVDSLCADGLVIHDDDGVRLL
jgi:A/G-specific adenine glycosylase